MAIQRSKYTGDPGVFDFLKKTVQVGLGLAGMLPGVGGIARTLGGALFPPAPGTTTYAQPPLSLATMPSRPQAGPGGIPVAPGYYLTGVGAAGKRACIKPWRYDAASEKCKLFLGSEPGFDPIVSGPGNLVMNGAMDGYGGGMDASMMAGRPAVSGYHWNKSGYFLKSGEYVPAGTKMVKNRRRNPANPRATSNAIMRIKGAKRYAKSLSAISIRKKC